MPKITDLTAAAALTDDDYLLLVDDPAGTPTTKKITAANAATYFGSGGSSAPPIQVALSDESTEITSTGNPKITMRMPYAMAVTEVRASLTTASSSGLVTVDINEGGTSILSTKLSIDQGEKTSTTASTPAVISDDVLNDDAEITFDIDAAGVGAKGLKVTLIGTRTVDEVPASGVTFVSFANTTYASRTNTIVSAPTGLTNDDYIILGIVIGESGTANPTDPTPPAGFTLIAGPIIEADGTTFSTEMRIYGKVASGEGSSWTFTHSALSSQGFALAYRGVDTGTSLDATPTTNSNTGGTTTATGLTTVTDNAMVVFVGHDWGSTTDNLTAPTGTTPTFTERVEVNPLIYVADGLMVTAGATGNKTMTNNSGGGGHWAASLVALRPA